MLPPGGGSMPQLQDLSQGLLTFKRHRPPGSVVKLMKPAHNNVFNAWRHNARD